VEQTLKEQRFEELLREAIDEGLSTLGESAKQATYYYLNKGFGLSEQEIPHRVGDFAAAIEKFFGLGASFLETLILKQLYEKVGATFKADSSKDLNFVGCIASAKQSIIKLEKSETEL
jgi:hypothetical protein